MAHPKISRTQKSHRAGILILLLTLAFVTMGSGTCVVIEENPYGMEEPGVNEERMDEQEIEVMEESNR